MRACRYTHLFQAATIQMPFKDQRAVFCGDELVEGIPDHVFDRLADGTLKRLEDMIILDGDRRFVSAVTKSEYEALFEEIDEDLLVA